MGYEAKPFDIKKEMDLTEEEEQFLDMYTRLPPELKEVVWKYMDGTEEEQAEAEKCIQGILAAHGKTMSTEPSPYAAKIDNLDYLKDLRYASEEDVGSNR